MITLIGIIQIANAYHWLRFAAAALVGIRANQKNLQRTNVGVNANIDTSI